jgi:hypothetical protein
MLHVLCAAGIALAAAQRGDGASSATVPATAATAPASALTLSPRALDGAANVLYLDVDVPSALHTRASRLLVAFRCGAWPRLTQVVSDKT